MSEASISILKSKKLRITKCRVDVIQHFVENNGAFSQSDLEKSHKSYDRVTIYRTLISLVEAGILHKIPSDSGSANYGLCHISSSSEKHFDNHIHFKCDLCGHIECLEDKEVPQISLPKGYKVKKVNLIVDGICVECT